MNVDRRGQFSALLNCWRHSRILPMDTQSSRKTGETMRRTLALLAAALFVCVRGAAAQCGGTERWPVKVGADPDANLVDVANPVPTLLHALVTLTRPTLPGGNDDTTRLPVERTVRTVDG